MPEFVYHDIGSRNKDQNAKLFLSTNFFGQRFDAIALVVRQPDIYEAGGEEPGRGGGNRAGIRHTVASPRRVIVGTNDLFDRFWSNSEEDIEYSVAYDDQRFNYHKHAGFGKWSKQKRMFGILPKRNASGRIIREEAVYVMW